MNAASWTLLIIVIGWGFGGGIAFRQGRLRRMGQWYFQDPLPAPIRTMPMQLVPIATFLLFIGLAAAFAPDQEEPASPLGLASFVASFVALGWWPFTMVRPSGFLKPDWLRAREAWAAPSPGDDRPMSRKAWENIGFASGGFALAIFLLWAGALGTGSFEHEPGTLITAVVLAVICVAAFLSARRAAGTS